MSQSVRVRLRLITVVSTVLLLAALTAPGMRGNLTAQVQDPCSPVVNPVACENSLPGNPSSEWDITGAGDAAIQGFATDISVNRGQTVRFKVNTAATAYRLDLYRLGYYGGAGARKVATVNPSVALPQAQPACTVDGATGLIDCGVWSESASWAVPATAVSGVYVAKLVRTDATPGSSHIVFVVRDDAGQSDVLFQTADTTWQAYNRYGGNSLYTGSPAGRAYKVSYNRPFTTRDYAAEDWLFNAEYPMLRWLEANGYNVSYSTGVDTDRRGAELTEHKVFLSVGHDEYWSAAQRANVEAARDAGVHLGFLSGNEIFWKTRWESSIDGSGTSYRTLVSYKDTHANAKIDPVAGMWTGTWRDTRFSPPNDGGLPENALSGQLFMVSNGTSAIEVPETLGKFRLWRNTSVATLATGTTATLSAGTLGYEWNEAPASGAPAGLVRLSQTTRSGVQKLQDFGSTYAPGTATHNLTQYRASSGALVFGAGTVQWSWGLDAAHDRTPSVPDIRMQQATVNLLADMDVQAGTLQSGLVAATASADTAVPTSTITSPTSGATVLVGTSVTITGTATDAGGLVAGVEVSINGGTTWQAATGTTAWTFAWTPTTAGQATLLSRAIDDSGNIGASSTAVNVTASTTLPGGCPCTLWPDTTVPAVVDAGADNAVNLGVKFRADADGYVTGVRFYKAAANVGTHFGYLWTTTGTLLASVAFQNESASGWQTATFSSPVAVTANTLYVASYNAPTGHYSFNSAYFNSARDRAPLHAPATSQSANGVFAYGAPGQFPNSTYNAGNYWVDVVFTPSLEDTTAPTVASVQPGPSATVTDINVSVTATFSETIDPATINTSTFELRDGATLISASVSYNAGSGTATLDPVAALTGGRTYTATLRGGATDPRVKDAAGLSLAADFVWSFTVSGDSTPPAVVSVTPAPGATNIATSATVTATFSEAIDASTINGSTFELRNTSNVVVTTAVTYDAANRRATLAPTAPLTYSTTYTATVKGGTTDPRVKDSAGNPLSVSQIWSFTTAAAPPTGCPCTLWSSTTTPAVVDGGDPGAIEVGVKFRTTVDGFINGLRFYKAATNTGTHLGNLWRADGTLLASLTFSNETASGWQQATFTTPVPVTANTTYVASYFAPAGHYSFSGAYFGAAVNAAPLQALANSTSPNGVYRYGAASGFPASSYNSSNYWVDVLFDTSAGGAIDTTAPTVTGTTPAAGGVGVAPQTTVTATFSEAMNPATISASTIELRDPSNVLVPATVSWNAAARTATLTPNAALLSSTLYTARVLGGVSDPRVKDQAGNPLAVTYSWSFTTGAVTPPPSSGPGGPILIVTTSGNPFSSYYAEILRAEGLNAFSVADLAAVTSTTLAGYSTVILGEAVLTGTQVTMFSNWVATGGNLIAMRPDKQLASLLGLADLGTTVSEGYLLMSGTGASAGLVNETIQFHGVADRYSLTSGTASVATLYTNATTATANPAVSLRSVGGGGQVAAFTYDLAKSIIYTRQGNPAWQSADRDGQAPVRSDDLFFPDYVDFNKIQIPQADEQMRLLANLIIQMTLPQKPLPRFWYLPNGKKAAIVMTGDDHANGGTSGRFQAQKNLSTPGCSVDNWECIRSTSCTSIRAARPRRPSPTRRCRDSGQTASKSGCI